MFFLFLFLKFNNGYKKTNCILCHNFLFIVYHKKETCSAQHLLKAGHIVKLPYHNSPQSPFEVKSVITYTDHFFEYVLFSKTILKFFCSEIGKGEVWEGKKLLVL